jgi:hypothetical protein
VKQKRAAHGYNGTWQPVSLYDSDGYFRGPAIFDNKRGAQEYMRIYNDRLQTRNNLNMSNNHDSKINNNNIIQLKIFAEKEKPQDQQMPFFFPLRRYQY